MAPTWPAPNSQGTIAQYPWEFILFAIFEIHMGHQMNGDEMKGNEARVNKHPLNPYYNYSQFFGWNNYTHTYITYVYVPRERRIWLLGSCKF
jgi:hypothetical protein